jgi:hypothetical protein
LGRLSLGKDRSRMIDADDDVADFVHSHGQACRSLR